MYCQQRLLVGFVEEVGRFDRARRCSRGADGQEREHGRDLAQGAQEAVADDDDLVELAALEVFDEGVGDRADALGLGGGHDLAEGAADFEPGAAGVADHAAAEGVDDDALDGGVGSALGDVAGEGLLGAGVEGAAHAAITGEREHADACGSRRGVRAAGARLRLRRGLRRGREQFAVLGSA
jgi:hypothetical protein